MPEMNSLLSVLSDLKMESDPIREEIKARAWEVPSFDIYTLKERRTKYVTIIPVLNEGARIRRQLKDMQDLGLTDLVDTVVVDGGTTDGSLDSEILYGTHVAALIVKTGKGKLSAQLRCAYAWALLEGYDGIITIDGNGKDGVETLPAFVTALDDGYDYVQASRFVKGGYSENTPLLRLIAIRLIHAPVLSLVARKHFTDTTQGYRGYSRQYLLDDRTLPFRRVFDGYELLAYLTVRASQLGYRVKELPTRRMYPSNEKIPTKISSVGALVDLMAILFKTATGFFHPNSVGKKSKDAQ